MGKDEGSRCEFCCCCLLLTLDIKALFAELCRYRTVHKSLSRFQSSSHPRAIERKREEKRESESPILCDSSEVQIQITSFTGSLYLVALASSDFYYLAVLV